ncbi:MAG: hypothetical protein A3B68_07735 [Candidatus Melainabacteria bacterium RIFCSPHIGHO2_02_FULL_34_12]|nr:MAG: hypothetical protein A3B68_07735 [Candidatus Melainabacteria bacterium RIFCSPHIGHO2_02_FULL_34_12]
MLQAFINSRTNLGIKFDLRRVKSCLNYLGNPQEKYKSIIVGGTNGKGSVTFYLSNLLSHFTDFKVGRYISPHLVNFNERFVINEKPLEICYLEKISNEVLGKIKDFESEANDKLTEFEIYTVIAFHLFEKENVDIACIEVGMGGKLDATNIVSSENILCSVITNVSFDHMQYLGDTLEKIACEKAGIIKENNIVITGADEPALSVIKEKAKELNTKLIHVDTEQYETYQNKNIEIALKTWQIISEKLNLKCSDYGGKNFLESLQFPGRFQYFKDEKILIDGAHNPAAATELKKLLFEKFPDKQIIYIVGLLDKDYESFLKNLIPEGSTVVCTEPKSERATKKEILAEYLKKINSKAILCTNLEEAIQAAKQMSNDLIVITGSLYLVGEALNVIARKAKPDEAILI